MSAIRTAAATALGAAIAGRISLAQPVAIVNEPPSTRAQYPAVAILIDHTDLAIWSDADLEVNSAATPGHPGFVLDGTFRTAADDSYIAGDVYVSPEGKTLSHVGTVRCQGRIWVGTRLAPQREQLEAAIWNMFFGERDAPGRLQVPLADVDVGGVRVPFAIGTATVSGSIWNAEHAFTERLWTYLAFELDAPVLVPRNDPMAKQLVLELSRDLATVAVPSDVNKLTDLTKVLVDSDGNATSTTI